MTSKVKNAPQQHTHPVLRNYVTYTYRRVAEEKKIAITSDEEYCCWNCGLITKNQKPIFLLFSRNRLENSDPYWHFWKFVRKGEWDLNRFSSLPEMPHYFDDPSILIQGKKYE